MSKSSKTYELEEAIILATARPNRIGCPEVNLGDFGIVDYLCLDLNEEHLIRCFELKISKSDFQSDSKKSFVGDYNYYVLPTELWFEVRNYIEKGIGVWLVDSNGRVSIKKEATRMKPKLNYKETMARLIRALNRENIKHTQRLWDIRQSNKKIKDFSGGPINIGDIVEYHGEKYVINSIEYNRNQIGLEPTLILVNENETSKILPGIVRKVPISDIIFESK